MRGGGLFRFLHVHCLDVVLVLLVVKIAETVTVFLPTEAPGAKEMVWGASIQLQSMPIFEMK